MRGGGGGRGEVGGGGPGAGPESWIMGLGPGAILRYVSAQYKSHLYELVAVWIAQFGTPWPVGPSQTHMFSAK